MPGSPPGIIGAMDPADASPITLRLADIPIPDSPACVLAHEVAAAYATARAVVFDAELLYVAAMLHDIGLVPEFDNHTIAFEDAGGHVAWVFAAGAGWPAHRRTRVHEVIVRHMWDEVDVAVDPEGFLLERSTGVDISGRSVGDFGAGLVREVLDGYPRLDLVGEFTACFLAQARRKPDSAAARLAARGIEERLAANPLER